MAAKPLPSVERLRNLLRYEPDTGRIFWRDRLRGKETFRSDCLGYRIATIDKMNLRAHRVAWALHYGVWPASQIDHLNGVRSDNRIVNLREADFFTNAQNHGLKRSNRSGVVGVSWSQKKRRWISRIKCRGVWYGLGYYRDLSDAAAVRRLAEEAFGFGPRHGLRFAS